MHHLFSAEVFDLAAGLLGGPVVDDAAELG